MKGIRTMLGFTAVLAATASTGLAGMAVTPLSGGLSTLPVAPGGSFSVDLMTSGTPLIDSAVFTVEFSKSGLQLTGYTWGGGFNGTPFDGSLPPQASLPVPVDELTYDTPGSIEKVDIYFDSYTATPFAVGTSTPLVTLTFTVPVGFDYGTPSGVTISVVPDTFVLGEAPFAVDGGQFTITYKAPGDLNADGKVDGTDFLDWQAGFGTVYDGQDFLDWQANFGTGVPSQVPEPGTLALLSLGAMVLTRRRRT